MFQFKTCYEKNIGNKEILLYLCQKLFFKINGT
ncbi:Uncharacterised protein [Prevotella disiens]|uniref:Uncharacterized protein n=1 Tax=Prevotella disiens TaxID=28130 RepID=A0A379EF91_9BACT|nr:Uncharacterised protein [Prevotella disiens]